MSPGSDWTRMVSSCDDAVRVLELHHVEGDTFAVLEDGGMSLSDKANLILMLKQLSGREDP